MAQKKRTIVIEIEKIQTIRKRAMTSLRHCDGCGAISDAVTHVEAAKLFETAPGNLFQFIKQHNCHYHISYDGKTYLCVVSLLEKIKDKNNNRLLMAKGE